MAETTGGKIWTMVKRAGAWLYTMAFKKGWKRWVFLAVVFALFLFIVSLVCGGIDYRRDPSALVPYSSTSTYLYVETRDLNALLKDAGEWGVWRERQGVTVDPWNHMQVSLAEMIGSKVGGLGTRLPLIWLAGAQRAAVAFTTDTGEGESWAIYLDAPEPEKTLAEIQVESGLTLERSPEAGPDQIFQLSGTGGGTLYLGVLSPWIIISSHEKMPRFAADSVRKPALSLAGSGLLPGWGRGMAIRGMFNPDYLFAKDGSGTPLSLVAGWMTPETRWSFIASVGRDGEMEAKLASGVVSDTVGGGGILWPVVKFILFWVGLLCLIVILGTISVMVGWGGWYKYMAVKAGIVPKPAPEPIDPSDAFKEDAGVSVAEPVVAVAPQETGTPMVTDTTPMEPDQSGAVPDGDRSD